MAYEDTPNKQGIRRCWDQPMIERRSSAAHRPLTYFGLTGPRIHDLIDWQHALGRERTAVESPGHTKKEREEAAETIGLLQANIFEYGLSSGFQLLVADVEDVLLDGVDQYGTPPQLNDGTAAHRARLRYDVINLDFDGGIGYRNKGGIKRLDALRKLFERQEGTDFLLFLTINVRDTVGDAIETDLRGMQSRDRGPDWRETLDWYLRQEEGTKAFKLKAVVPSFIKYVSEPRGFSCYSHPPITYVGHNSAHMIHFAFELRWQVGVLRGWGDQDDRHLLELPMIECADGTLRICVTQHPGFRVKSYPPMFDSLHPDVRAILVAEFERWIIE